MKPDPAKVEAVRKFETPTSKKELDGYLGMFVYLAQYAPSLSEKTHKLTKQDAIWCWTPEHDKAFQEVKEMITNTPGPVLQYFDSRKPVVLQVDVSLNGLGMVLFQDKGPIAYASKAMTETQINYFQIEKEMSAIVFGCQKFNHYVLGRSFDVQSYHNPLKVIFKKPLHTVAMRLQRMRIRLQMYDLNVKFTPGKDIPGADMLSRQVPRSEEVPVSSDLDEEAHAHVHLIKSHLPVSSQMMAQIRTESGADEQLQVLVNVIQNGWSSTIRECPTLVKDFWIFRDELSVVDWIVYKGSKIAIPAPKRKEILD